MNVKTEVLFKKSWKLILTGALAFSLIGCSTDASNTKEENNAEQENLTFEEIEKLAKKEGKIVSVGMPDSWANYGETWKELSEKYGLKHSDTDMSSAEEIAKFEAEKNKPTADFGDIGISYGPLAVEKGITLPYKTSYWDDVPEWAKDKDGHWIVGYQGTMAIITNKKLVKNPPKSWADIKSGDYKVAVGDVVAATQAQMAILAAAKAFGGDEKNIQPGIDFFADLAKKGRLSMTDVLPANFEKGEVEVGFLWDFNALGYRDQIDPERFEVVIPSEASVVSGYATIINKYAPHPNAGKVAREYILSDEGQINYAKGYARPIRENVKLPDDVASKLLSNDQYANATPIKDYTAWEETVKTLPQKWQEEVLVHVK